MKKCILFIFCILLFFTVTNPLFAQEGQPSIPAPAPTLAPEPTAQQPQVKQEPLPPVPLVKQNQPITLSPTTPFPQPTPSPEPAPETPPPTTPTTTLQTTPPVTEVPSATTPAATTSTGAAKAKKRPAVRVTRETLVLPSGEKSDLPVGWAKPTELKPGEMRLEDLQPNQKLPEPVAPTPAPAKLPPGGVRPEDISSPTLPDTK